ncbi:MAG TPA: hypothetical protein VIU35_00445 [Chitinophagaceae bacterium]
MKKNLNLTILTLVLFLAGCQKDIQLSTEQSISEETMAKAPSAGNNTINLSVEVDDLTGIESDGQGLYVNGIDRVQAQILSSDGNFFMNTNNNGAKLAIRTMLFLSGNPELNLNDPINRNYSLRTSAATPLQNMDANGGTQLVGFRVWAFQQHGAISWKLLFRMGIEDYPESLTSYANVTRNGDTWTIEAADPNANARLADGNSPATPFGLYVVPFKLTLTKIGR